MSEPVRTRPFAPFEWLLSTRYLRARRKEGFISVIAGFSFLGIMLGVATLIIVMAVMNGFRKELLDKILGLNGHLLVQPLESPLTDWKVVAERINTVQGIRLAAPIVEGQAFGLRIFEEELAVIHAVERLGDNLLDPRLVHAGLGEEQVVGQREVGHSDSPRSFLPRCKNEGQCAFRNMGRLQRCCSRKRLFYAA